MRKKRLALAAAVTTLLSVMGLAVSPSSAQAATAIGQAYGSTTNCRLSDTSTRIYLAPHFGIAANGSRQFNGYSYYTSPADTIYFVTAEVSYWEYPTRSTTVYPWLTSAIVSNLSSAYYWSPAGTATVTFKVKDADMHWCYASVRI